MNRLHLSLVVVVGFVRAKSVVAAVAAVAAVVDSVHDARRVVAPWPIQP